MIAATTEITAIGSPQPTKNELASATIAAISAQGASRVSSTAAVTVPVSVEGCQSVSRLTSSSIGPVTITGSTPTGPVGSRV